MNIKVVLLLLLFISSSDDWELRKNSDNIEVYTRKVSTSDFKELKSHTVVKSSLSSIVKVLIDADHFTEWIYRCVSANAIRKKSETEIYTYQLFEAPWPFDNRDVVAVVKVTQNKITKVVSVVSTLADNLVPEKDGVVRIRKFRTMYTLVPKGSGMVEINYELGTEPGGVVPAWLANLLMVNGPFSTQQKINELVQTPLFKNAKLGFIAEP